MELTSVLVTGGRGFVGGNFVRLALKLRPRWRMTIFDSMGGRPRPVLEGLDEAFPGRLRFVQGRVTDTAALDGLFASGPYDAVVHFAARNPSGQDASDPVAFAEVNVMGTAMLLDWSRRFWTGGEGRFLHLSSYEVYGSSAGGIFSETSPLNPSTPYAASKAAADQLTLAYHRTFGTGCLVTRTTNIYGPYQSEDKLVPAIVRKVRDRRPLPVYGDGSNTRDWIHVDDHNRGVLQALERGRPGEVYHLGARCERSNLALVKAAARATARALGRDAAEAEALVTFVGDRAGHDARRALDPGKAERELEFRPEVEFEQGLDDTVRHFLAAR
jgi:dTDP-glucose 4,6-dehydratase